VEPSQRTPPLKFRVEQAAVPVSFAGLVRGLLYRVGK